MAQLRVLVVDDAAFIREMVRKAIRGRFPSMQVEDAINGRKAQQLMEKSEFDLVLCDWEMPEMSGIELLTWVRQEKKSKVPFVMVTSRGDKANVVEAIQAGVTDYIGKPFSNEGLLNKIIKVMSKRHNLRDLEGGTGPANSGRVGDGSIGALTGGKRVSTPSQKPAPQRTRPVVDKPKSKPSAKPVSTKGPAQLRFADTNLACQIKAISLKQIVLICPVAEGLPGVLESVVVDLEQQASGGSEVARINAFVTTLKADVDSIECETVTVTTNIVDQDPDKLAYISKLIARGTTASGYVPGA